jgi:hypothetical protein
MSFYDSWSDVQELSPKEVYSSIRKYWSTISALQKLLLDTQKLFASTQTIWPDQCGWIIDDFRLLAEYVQAFSDFLDTSSQFSGSFRLVRYPLVQKLHYLDAQLHELCILLIAFRAHCQMSTYNITGQTQEISACLKKLLQHWRRLRREVQFVLEQIEAPAQEKERHTIIHIEDFERS